MVDLENGKLDLALGLVLELPVASVADWDCSNVEVPEPAISSVWIDCDPVATDWWVPLMALLSSPSWVAALSGR